MDEYNYSSFSYRVIVGKRGLFYFGLTTGLGEGKL